MTYYKILGDDGKPLIANTIDKWPLPTSSRKGEWTPKRAVKICISGWHLIPLQGLSEWLQVGWLYEAEGKPENESKSDSYDKIVYPQARLIRLVGKIELPQIVDLAQQYAEHVSHLKTAAYADAAAYAAADAAAAAATYAAADCCCC